MPPAKVGPVIVMAVWEEAAVILLVPSIRMPKAPPVALIVPLSTIPPDEIVLPESEIPPGVMVPAFEILPEKLVPVAVTEQVV